MYNPFFKQSSFHKGALHSKFHPSLTGPPSYMSQSPIGRELSYSGPAKSSPQHDSKSHSGRSTAYHTVPPNVVFGDESFHQNSAHFRGGSILGGLRFQMTTISMNMIIRMIILMKNLTLVIVNLVLNLQLEEVGKENILRGMHLPKLGETQPSKPHGMV